MKGILVFHLILFSTASLFGLPRGMQIASGKAYTKMESAKTLRVIASDKTILNFSSFDISAQERVSFVQPSKASRVLARIVDGNPSKIFGSLKANGSLFLLNPSGIFFGPDATIDTGALIASTMDLSDRSFLEESFVFTAASQSGFLVNEGQIFAEEFAALLGPVVQNRGSVVANAGDLFVGAAEKIVLDFSGDGLIHFALEGELKQALIENHGTIQALSGRVEIAASTVRELLVEMVNCDGMTPADALMAVDGVIRLVANSEVAAKSVKVDGGANRVALQGGGLRTDGGALLINGTVTLGADTLLETSGGSMTLGGSVDGPALLTLSADQGDIFFKGGVGTSEPLCGIEILSARNVTTSAEVCASFFVQRSGSGTTDLQGAVFTTGPKGVYLKTCEVIRGSSWVSGGTGGVTVLNEGCFTSVAPGSIAAKGGMKQEGSGLVLLAGSIETDNTDIYLEGPIILAGACSWNSGSGFGSIIVQNCVNGSSDLTVNCGQGDLSFYGSVGRGTILNNFIIQSVRNVFLNSLFAVSISQVEGAGRTLVTGELDAIGEQGIFLTGNEFVLSGEVTTDAGPLIVQNRGPLVLSGCCCTGESLKQTGMGPATLSSQINSNGEISFCGPVHLTGCVSLDSSRAASDIVFEGVVEGGKSLSLQAGEGSIKFKRDVKDLRALVVNEAAEIMAEGVSAEEIRFKNVSGMAVFNGFVETKSACLDCNCGVVSTIGQNIGTSQ